MISVFFAHVVRNYVTHHPCVWYAYSSHMLRIILAYDMRILRVCYAYPCVWNAYSSHMLRIILAYDMRILRICYASSLCMKCVFFAYVTHHPCVWYAYSSCMLRVSLCMLHVSVSMHVTPTLRKCPRQGVVAPFPPIVVWQNIFTSHFWNVNSNSLYMTI